MSDARYDQLSRECEQLRLRILQLEAQHRLVEARESRHADAELSSQARLLDLSSDAILMRDASNRIIYWNRGAELLYGYTREEVIGRETFTLLKQRFPQPFGEVMETLWREGHWEGELGQTRRDGSQITVLTRWVLDRAPANGGKPACILVINTDITARKQAEQALREHQDILALAMRGGRIGVWWQNFENDAVWWSRELEEIVGLAPGSFAGNQAAFRAFVHPEDQEAITQAVNKAVADHADYAVEIRFRHVDGSFRWMDGRGRATYDAAGRPLRLYGIGIDITERKQAEIDVRFLADVGQIFTGASDAQALMGQVSGSLAAHLSTNRAGFATFDEARQQATIHRDYSAGAPSIAGTYRMWWLGSSLMNDLHAGKLLIIEDVQADPRTAHIYTQALGPGGMRSVVLVPLLRMGRCVAGLFVTRDVAHVWTDREIDLLRVVAERTWLAVESARVQTETQALNTTLEARVAERTDALHRSREQLRQLTAYVDRAREDERARIAREVHDELGGALTVLKMSLSQVVKRLPQDTGVMPRVEDLGAQIDALVQSVRRISYDLRPSMLDDFGLLAAMEWQAHEWQRRTGIACRLVFDQDMQVDLNSRSRTAVFRVFQESLTNIARHSQASEVVVSAELAAGHLVLTVKDNGRGISEEALHSVRSLGLVGMRERIREVDGELDIASAAAGGGVTVTLRVPLDASHSERSEAFLPPSTRTE
jgi:PAS domain S-box-containing protein